MLFTGKEKRAQAAADYIMVAAIVALIVIPTAFLFYRQASGTASQIDEAQINKFGKEVVSAAETVYYMGPPSKITLEERLPENVIGISIDRDPVLGTYLLAIAAKTRTATTNFTYPTKVKLVGTFRQEELSAGIKKVRVEAGPVTGGQQFVTIKLVNRTGIDITTLDLASLEGNWHLDNATTDASGNGFTLTATNGANCSSSIPGKFNTGCDFDGMNDYLSCTDANCGGTANLDMGTRNWTIMAWIKGVGPGLFIVTKMNYFYGGGPDGWFIGISPTGRISSGIGDTAAGHVTSADNGAVVNDTTWHHIAVVFNRQGSMVRYADGVATGTANSITALASASVDNTDPFAIGGRTIANDELAFNGTIDEVRIYAEALTAAQIDILSRAE